ncbi:restriction endonuclease subunit S [Streptomyces griseoluteus]|uniref:Restriction endonuclease subunit S n=1 Tax=Streptomyces griseoluteus TaxID=29306 RepID=A0A4Z1D5Q8_STRGP|nr:restriction endonuclease subunit S [Streptomyces griseoluteus]TGN77508.1 restriction endonuclease subunit S [Streptomyces griseoluteus]GHF24884.1 hypothetical protein GCM10017776_49110 [Streptomyces griseoluteus]
MSISAIQQHYRPLAEMADVSGGVALGGVNPGGFAPELPYLRVANVQDGRISTDDVKTVRIASTSVERFRLRVGDVLLTEGGDFDKLGRGAVWDGRIDPCLHQNHVFRVRCDTSVLIPEFLSLYMASREGRSFFLGIAKQTTNLATISSSQLKAMPIPFMPVAVQRRIVEVLASMTELDRRIEASIAKTRLIRKEVARHVLLGGDRHLRKLRDVAAVSSGGTPSRARRDFWDGGDVPWIRTGEIDFNVITETGEYITRKAVHEAGLRVYPQGTVLLAMYGDGATRGRVASLGIHAAINQAAAAIVCDPRQVDHRYLYYFLEMQYAEIRNIGQGSNRSNLSSALVGAIEIPLPSVEEQRDLVISLESFDSDVQADLAELAKLRELKHGLMDDLLSGRAMASAVAA